MADVLINDLSNAGTLTDSMQFEVDTGGTTSNKVLATVIASYMQSNLNHDSFSDFVGNKHINHSSVVLTAGTGISGGGDITTNRTFNLDVNGLTSITSPTTNDTFPVYDSSAGAVRKCEGQYLSLVHNHDSSYATVSHTHSTSDVISGTFSDSRISQSSVTQHTSSINHNALLNFSSNEHIDHTGVVLTAGTGLSGGGNISSSRTLNLDINGLTSQNSPTSVDTFAFYDSSATGIRKCNGTALGLTHTHDHDTLTNFVGNEHINHTSVTLTAGIGLSGGGDISSSRSFNLDITGLTTENSPTSSDEFCFYDSSATAVRKCQGQYLNLVHNHDSSYSPLLLEETTEKTSNYTMVLGDAFKVVWMNGSSLTLTVPTNSSVSYSIGTVINVYNSNSTALTIQGDTGVTVRNSGTIPQYSEASLRKRATNEWVLVGDIT